MVQHCASASLTVDLSSAYRERDAVSACSRARASASSSACDYPHVWSVEYTAVAATTMRRLNAKDQAAARLTRTAVLAVAATG